jgi:hypothetical protein
MVAALSTVKGSAFSTYRNSALKCRGAFDREPDAKAACFQHVNVVRTFV